MNPSDLQRMIENYMMQQDLRGARGPLPGVEQLGQGLDPRMAGQGRMGGSPYDPYWSFRGGGRGISGEDPRLGGMPGDPREYMYGAPPREQPGRGGSSMMGGPSPMDMPMRMPGMGRGQPMDMPGMGRGQPMDMPGMGAGPPGMAPRDMMEMMGGQPPMGPMMGQGAPMGMAPGMGHDPALQRLIEDLAAMPPQWVERMAQARPERVEAMSGVPYDMFAQALSALGITPGRGEGGGRRRRRRGMPPSW